MSLAAMLADREKVVTTAALVLAAVLAWAYTLLTAVHADPAMDMRSGRDDLFPVGQHRSKRHRRPHPVGFSQAATPPEVMV